jgi:nucleotide-binding universal stress UspA family protein
MTTEPVTPVPAGPQIVVGHDGHRAAQAALATAVDLAGHLGAHLHVVHSVTLADYGVDPDIEQFELTRDRNLAAERAAIADALLAAPVTWTYHEERGDPAVRLARLADQLDAAYIVVGATHRAILHIFGSVPKRLVHCQTRPVIVVPDPQTAHRPSHHAGGAP